MAEKKFQIEFTYQEIPYVGIVEPIDKGKETWYKVFLESENQESRMEIIAKPSKSALEDWDFECEDAGNPLAYSEKELLQETGEAIEKYLTSPQNPESSEKYE